ncbi:MAG: aminotransferase class I/II-fold pyridoxal phosphate-dependent enzyme [Eubacterium sp.]|nr:aminotransferase class I/II-fold pyridoxal phosphate-dependent enzyme [Eubacterium sp.]
MKLNDKLKKLDSYPFHMPGHKRNMDFDILGAEIDITEIDGFDNLHCPTGAIADMQDDIAEIYGYGKSILSVNGSTGCILAAISAVSRKGDKIIIARNCHKSVYNACYINGLNIIYIEPEFDSKFGMYTYVTQDAVDKAIEDNPDACAVVMTSPTYEGFISNVKCDVPLIIDSAHGAHFGMSGYLPNRQEGDIIIQSLHKTLPALTQTAVIHINNPSLEDKVKMYMDIYVSSSPSYILLASIDRCIDFLKNRDNSFAKYKILLDEFYEKVCCFKNIEVLKNDDVTRIVLMSKNISGTQFARELREYGIEVEGATINYVILISTVCDTKEGFDLLLSAIEKINGIFGEFTPYISKCSIPQKAKTSDTLSRKKVTLNESVGMISAEHIYAYPPAVPIIAPNEIISQDIVEAISRLLSNGVTVISDSGLLPNEILTKGT